MPRFRNSLISLLLILAALMVGCDTLKVTHLYEGGVVVTVSPIASEVGRRVLDDGGNAFDAAVAVGLAMAVVSPQAGNLGGGGFAVMREGASGEVTTLDFRETAPASATVDMFLDPNGDPIDSLSTIGAMAAGVPGSVAGLYAIWEQYGTVPWADLARTAAMLADTGFIVDDWLGRVFVDGEKRLVRFEETRSQFMPEGRPVRAGERLIQPDLARTLYAVAAEGPDGFYSGPVADSLIACMTRYNGAITHEDLRRYRPVWRAPIHFRFDSLDIYSMPPPSSGGVIIGQILKLLEPFDFSRYTPESAGYIHLFCEASRLAYADRSEHLGDPAFWEVPSTRLDSGYLAGRRERISLDHAGNSAEVEPGHPAKYESESTTQISICDHDGNMVSLTTTLNSYFGSSLVVSGAGFLLNNEMDDFSVKPGSPNLYGLVGAEANKIEPGKRMLSSMAPTLVLKDGQPYLVAGSPGGSKIISTVAEGILNFTRFDLSLEETVNRPRFHHQWLPDSLYLEKGGYSGATVTALKQLGHAVAERTPYGALEMIHIDRTGLMTGAADSRRGGAVAGCDAPLIH